MSDTIQLKSDYEGAQTHSTDPVVAVRNNVISPIECAYLIELAKPHIKRAGVVLDEGYKPSEGRTGSNHWLKYDEDDVVQSIGQRIADIVGLPLANAESMQIIHYGPEQEYRPHFDAFNLTQPRGQRAAQWGGQRLVTALVYLNKVEAGGATQFPKLGITVPAQPGRMVLFHNTTEDISGPHPLSLHAGMPVESGEKWAFNLWFRLHDIRESYDASKPLPRISLSEDAPAASRVIAEPVVTEMPPIAPLSVANDPAKQRLTVVANRADVLWQRAVKTLKARDNKFTRVYACYWDSYGNKPQPDTPAHWSGPSFRTAGRQSLNPLSDVGTVVSRLTDLGLSHVVPCTFERVQDAVATNPKPDELWFIRPRLRGAKDKTLCVPTAILMSATLPAGHLLQRAENQLALIDQHKFTTRIYLAVIGEVLYRFQESVAFIHGSPYAPNDANFASQTDNQSYRESGSSIRLLPGSQTPHAHLIEQASHALVTQVRPLLNEVEAECTNGAFAVLALDTLLTKAGDLKLIRVHTFPNFITTGPIDADVHVPLFEDILRVMAGLPSRQLVTIT